MSMRNELLIILTTMDNRLMTLRDSDERFEEFHDHKEDIMNEAMTDIERYIEKVMGLE